MSGRGGGGGEGGGGPSADADGLGLAGHEHGGRFLDGGELDEGLLLPRQKQNLPYQAERAGHRVDVELGALLGQIAQVQYFRGRAFRHGGRIGQRACGNCDFLLVRKLCRKRPAKELT